VKMWNKLILRLGYSKVQVMFTKHCGYVTSSMDKVYLGFRLKIFRIFSEF